MIIIVSKKDMTIIYNGEVYNLLVYLILDLLSGRIVIETRIIKTHEKYSKCS